MKRFSWEIRLGVAFLLFSLAVGAFKLSLFGHPRDTIDYLLDSLIFLPIQVYLVTVILNQLITRRDRRAQLEKLNMVVGTFFSEMGGELLSSWTREDRRLHEIGGRLLVNREWRERDFQEAHDQLQRLAHGIDIRAFQLEKMNAGFAARRDFMIRLLENPILLEHQIFTDMLRALFHLSEEVARRMGLADLPESDYQHLSADLNRAYHLLVIQWLDYMKHLKAHYPYLFSFALRTNPFDPGASVVVTEPAPGGAKTTAP